MLPRCFLLLLTAIVLSAPAPAQSTPPAYLQHAFLGVNTLQGWYTPSTGLYQTTGWWNAGNSITVLANYSRLDHTHAYDPIFANTLVQAQHTFPNFLNDYYDDEGWWALAWIDVYDHTGKPEYLAAARTIFQDMTGAWDPTCGGGIWWSKARQYKNAIANELFLSVAASLAARAANATERDTDLGWAQREWTWFQGSGMINGQNTINDGLDTATCKNNGGTVWSYNQGVVLGGLVQLSQLTQDPSLVPKAQTIADAAIANLTDSKGILHDVCEPNCGGDGPEFKGVFLRNLVPLQAVVHDPRYQAFANINADSIWSNDRDAANHFGVVWSGPFDNNPNGASQNSALDALLAAAAMGTEQPGGGMAPSFTLTASPATLNITSGHSAQTTISLASGSGFTGAVNLGVTPIGAPAGLQATLANTTLTGAGSTTLSVSTTAATPGGNYLVAVTGLSGSLFQTAYVTVSLPDFSLSPAQTTVYLNQRGLAEDKFTISPLDGFTDPVRLTVAGLPTGVGGRFIPPTTTTTSTLVLSAATLTPTTSGSPFSVTGASGPTVHTTPTLSVAVSAALSNCGLGTPVNLAPAYNLTALRTDGSAFSDGGLDGLGSALSANLVGPSRVLDGIHYVLGPANQPDAIYAAGQTIALPPGRFSALQWLGTAIGGRQSGQLFTVTYTDGTTTQAAQSLSDWFSPALNANEDEAVAMPYRNTSTGAAQNVPFNLYGYTLLLDPAKTVQSLTLPGNRNNILLAATLSPVTFGQVVNLAGDYNATGIVTDGTTFPGNGGADGVGFAYSANVLGDSAASGTQIVVGPSAFHLAPANVPNVVYAAGQTIALPVGNYRTLKLLGTGVGGNQIAQPLVIHYTDGTSQTVQQSFSDWFSLGGYANESLAIRAAYRDASDGSIGNQPFNIYLYTLNLNGKKLVASITLPKNRSVVLLGITLAPLTIFDLEPYTCGLFGGPASTESALTR